ncbi:MAG: EAL domain-containing protein [Lachnospiraceae bacterium]|nr:EAL domain-containing protein [Lachnospiraceae bacterium]
MNDSLQSLQENLSALSGTAIFCIGSDGEPVTRISGDEDDIKLFGEFIPEESIKTLISRVSESPLEDQAVEDTSRPDVRYAAVSVLTGTRPVITWVVFAAFSDYPQDEIPEDKRFRSKITSDSFLPLLDTLREASILFIESMALPDGKARNQAKAVEDAEKIKEGEIRRSEAVMRIIRLLESEESIERIFHEYLSVAGEYLNLTGAQICQIHVDNSEIMDVVAEWYAQGYVSNFDRSLDQERLPYAAGSRVSFWSDGEQTSPRISEALISQGICAEAVAPIYVNGKPHMYMLMESRTRGRRWSMEDRRFISGTSHIVQSIVNRRVEQNSLAGSFASLSEVLDNVGSAIYLRAVDNGSIVFANSTMRSTFPRELKMDSLRDIFESRIPDNSRSGSFEFLFADGVHWYEVYYTELTWMGGQRVMLLSIHEITEKKEYQNRIEQQAYTDFLTGMYNRMCCERDLARFIDYARANGESGLLLYFDLDDFKHINDGLGHQYGDALLQSIAHSLKKISGIKDTCYRMGGDEFVVIVPPAEFSNADDIIEEIREVFRRPWFLKGADYYCTMSMGIVRFPEFGTEVQEVIRCADVVMYDAKRNGKNNLAWYSGNNVEGGQSERLSMEKYMREATIHDISEFKVYFQPITDIKVPGYKCTGAEALIRWNSTELGFISPADFIPLAEYLGLINPIGQYVLEQACEACRRWNENGCPDYKVNVNLSVVQLLQDDIVDRIKNTIEKTGVNPMNLTLEVTESLAINDLERMKEILGEIKETGARIALDDFGTGYSSLNHIREIPLNVIKVDQSFVKDLAWDTYSQSFIRMVAELAENLDKRICVEGIETRGQIEVLKDMNVRMVQGFYFDRPMPAEDFEKKYVLSENPYEKQQKEEGFDPAQIMDIHNVSEDELSMVGSILLEEDDERVVVKGKQAPTAKAGGRRKRHSKDKDLKKGGES